MKEATGNQAGNREAHAGNRAGPVDTGQHKQSIGGKTRAAAQTNRNSEQQQRQLIGESPDT
jgi:hypothetical protein